MNITVYNEFRLEVRLTEKELRAYDITYEDFDYSNIETRRVLWTILDEAKHKSGADINMSGKLLIEVCMLDENGISISFTSLPPRGSNTPSVKQLIKTQESALILETDDLGKCVDAALAGGFTGRSALFEKNGIYRLVFYADSQLNSVLCARICRFGELHSRRTRMLLASTDELWNKIEGESAVEKLLEIS